MRDSNVVQGRKGKRGEKVTRLYEVKQIGVSVRRKRRQRRPE